VSAQVLVPRWAVDALSWAESPAVHVRLYAAVRSPQPH
jgi:hypothetical protein